MRAIALCSLVLAVSACKIEDPFDTLTSITAALTDSTTDATASAGTTSGGSSGDVTATSGSTGDVPTTGSSNSDSATSQGSTGEPGTSGSTGGGSTTTAGSTGGGTTGGGGADPYGPCEMSNPPCPMGSDCVQTMGIEGNFCSPQCGMSDCPDFAGTAQPMCVLTLGMGMSPTNCALICDPMGNDCPMGSSCKQIPNQPVGVCTYP